MPRLTSHWLQQSPFATSPAGSVYLSSAACHSWPLLPATSPPTAVPAVADFPVVISGRVERPITPPSHAERIFARYRSVADTYLIETSDGPHVTFGRARRARRRRGRPPYPRDPAIDHAVDVPRRDRRTVPAFPDSAPSTDPIAFRAAALDLELLAHPDYWSWDGVEPLTIGCRYGGRLEVRMDEEAGEPVERIEVDRCAIVGEEPMDGTGIYRGPDAAEFDVGQLTSSSRTGVGRGPLHEGRRPRIGRMERSVPRVEIDGRR